MFICTFLCAYVIMMIVDINKFNCNEIAFWFGVFFRYTCNLHKSRKIKKKHSIIVSYIQYVEVMQLCIVLKQQTIFVN